MRFAYDPRLGLEEKSTEEFFGTKEINHPNLSQKGNSSRMWYP